MLKSSQASKAMASCQFLSYIILTNLFFFFFFISPSHSYSDSRVVSSSYASTQKVDLSLYYETLCPYCASFIVDELVNVFNKGFISFVNLRLVPWGNAMVAANHTIICQHGPDECLLNTVDACIINIWPDVKQHFNYIHCIENIIIKKEAKDVKSCFQKEEDWKKIENCYKSGHGEQLERQYGSETDHLNPLHEYVPWVVVNNKPLKEDYDNFLSYVCEAYRGPTPDPCKSLEFKAYFPERNPMDYVCYAGDDLKETSSTAGKAVKGLLKIFGLKF